MRWILIIVCSVLAFGCKPSIYLQKDKIQLSKPMIEAKGVFFEGSTIIKILPTAANADLIYSTSNNKSQKYKIPILVNQSTRIVAQAVGGGFIPSDSSSLEVLQLPKNEIVSIKSKRELNDKYGQAGLNILIDRKKGGNDFNDGWLGYLGDTMVFDLTFDILDVDYIVMSTLRNQGAWIFSPGEVNVYHEGNLLSKLELKDAVKELNNANVFTRIDIPNTNTRQLTIEIITPKEIPSWHSGKGTKPWVFIDEILIY